MVTDLLSVYCNAIFNDLGRNIGGVVDAALGSFIKYFSYIDYFESFGRYDFYGCYFIVVLPGGGIIYFLLVRLLPRWIGDTSENLAEGLFLRFFNSEFGLFLCFGLWEVPYLAIWSCMNVVLTRLALVLSIKGQGNGS